MTKYSEAFTEKLMETVAELEQQVYELRTRVMWLGDRADVCTFDDLGVRCDYCRCSRLYSFDVV